MGRSHSQNGSVRGSPFIFKGVCIMRRVMVMIVVLMGLALGALSASGITRTAEKALLPKGRIVSPRTPSEDRVLLYLPNGWIMPGTGTCTNFDGYIDYEWANATVYDISDTCGQSDGLPNEPETCYLYLMADDAALYVGVDAPGDIYQDYYDQCGFFFDDDDDGCWPLIETNEGNIWLVEDLAGSFCQWRWWREDGACDPDNFQCEYGSNGGFYFVYPLGWGSGTASGNMQYEMGVNFGDMADEEWELQTYFNYGESCGFYMYCLDQYYYDFIGEMPCTGLPETYRWPCYWPSIWMKIAFLFRMEVFQYNVPIGGSLDFAKHFHNNTCQTMTIYDTLYAYKGGNVVKTFAYEWTLECEQDLDVCFALQVPEKDMFICWDITIVNSGVAVAGGDEYPFGDSFDVHIVPGHKSEVECP
jgi:hypothetical protein